jgi:hypothetical protein
MHNFVLTLWLSLAPTMYGEPALQRAIAEQRRANAADRRTAIVQQRAMRAAQGRTYRLENGISGRGNPTVGGSPIAGGTTFGSKVYWDSPNWQPRDIIIVEEQPIIIMGQPQ